MIKTTNKKERKLSKKQKGFVNDYVETGNGKQSIIKNYNIEDPHSTLAAVMAVENLAKPNIIKAIEDSTTKVSNSQTTFLLLLLSTLPFFSLHQ